MRATTPLSFDRPSGPPLEPAPRAGGGRSRAPSGPRPRLAIAIAAAALLALPLFPGLAGAAAQQADGRTEDGAAGLSEEVKKFVSVDAPVVALEDVRVIDGTGAGAREGQTVLVRDGRIAAVGPSDDVDVPEDAEVLDLSGHTVIPGFVGMHDHLFYTAAGGRRAQLNFSAPRLYLGAGVTTIRTTGSTSPYADINLKEAVDRGQVPGPTIFITAPYITGQEEGPGQMAVITSPEQARRFVSYWAEEGATWIKAYTDIHEAELSAAIEEAHDQGLKVTGHLCSVTYERAVELGIDNLEHGLPTASDFVPGKEHDRCPSDILTTVGKNVDLSGAEVEETIRTMVENDVAMTSTLAVYEPFVPDRPTKDPRTLEAMAPGVREDYLEARARIDTSSTWPITREMFRKAMEFERRFFEAGGLLAAGVDPTGIGGALPGFGDQRNFELLVEAGLSPIEAVQVVSANGAKVLGIYDEVGSIEEGKVADLVVLEGDPTATPSDIRNVKLVFRDGVGFDSKALIDSVEGRVGIE